MKILCFVFLAMPIICVAQPELKELVGKWQEESRTQAKDKGVDFKDTIKMEIRADGFMMIRYTKGATITGQAEVKGQKLKFEHLKFAIVDVKDSQLVLSQDNVKHVFKKLPEFTSSPVTKRIPGVEEGKKDISLNILKGKWSCYKKTDSEFSRAKYYIRSIDFREENKKGIYTGTTTFNNNDSVYSNNAVITVMGNNLIIKSDQQIITAKVLKSDGEELILQDGNINYFMKQFGKKD